MSRGTSSDNRQKFPKKEKVPAIELPKENKYLDEARQYVEQYFPKNYGSRFLMVFWLF